MNPTDHDDSIEGMLEAALYQDAWNIDDRLDRASRTKQLETVMMIVLALASYTYDEKKRVAHKYSSISKSAEKWLLTNLRGRELTSYIKENGVGSIKALLANPEYQTQLLVIGAENTLLLSQLRDIVDQLPQDEWSPEVAELLMRCVMNEEVYEDTPRDEVVKETSRKAYDWAKDLPDSWLQQVFLPEDGSDEDWERQYRDY